MVCSVFGNGFYEMIYDILVPYILILNILTKQISPTDMLSEIETWQHSFNFWLLYVIYGVFYSYNKKVL